MAGLAQIPRNYTETDSTKLIGRYQLPCDTTAQRSHQGTVSLCLMINPWMLPVYPNTQPSCPWHAQPDLVHRDPKATSNVD